MEKSRTFRLSWVRLFVLTIITVYVYIFMEWLFFITKPSFMDALPVEKKLEIFLLTGLAFATAVLPCLIFLWILGRIPGPTKRWQIFLFLAGLIPAFIAAALSLLLIDNFTYTIFQFGIISSQGLGRGVYAGLAVLLFALWYRQVLLNLRVRPSAIPAAGGPVVKSRPNARQLIPLLLIGGLLVVSLGVGSVRVASSAGLAEEGVTLLQRQPNIILLGGDGVDVANLSLYGYPRETTPRLEQLAETGVLAENNFTNAAHSAGSVFSILTGKYPAQTRLLYSPNILQGEDALQHLPGILQRAGYKTVEIAFPYYIDAYDVNLQEGFDVVNERSVDQGRFFRYARQFQLGDVAYFIPRLSERILDRLGHIFFIRDMPDPYHYVIQAVDPNIMKQMNDEVRITQLIRQLREAKQPLFVHIHLMYTHGPTFTPRKQVFSAGEEQTRNWMPDFFDDAVLDFDSYVGELLDELTSSGMLDQTVLVVYSDHVHGWQTNARIPLLFRFPNGEFAGRIRNNTQNLDIAPTLLDYLGMEKPGWMPGRSLLAGEPESTRPIISAGVIGLDCPPPDWWCAIDQSLVKPPFYQFGYLQIVICQKLYTLTLSTNQLSESDVSGHTAPCNENTLPNGTQVRRIMLDHLRTYGFDVSSLE